MPFPLNLLFLVACYTLNCQNTFGNYVGQINMSCSMKINEVAVPFPLG